MASTIDQAFGTLADADMWEEGGAALAGFLAPTLARNALEGSIGMDLPDEAYGVAVVALSQFSPAYEEYVAIGGAAYTGDKLLERFGLKQTVTGGNL